MKKQLFSIYAVLAASTVFAQTASPSWSTMQNAGFASPFVGARFLDAVDNNVAWMIGLDATGTRRNYNWFSVTTNGGNNWTSGNVFQSTATPAVGDTNTFVLANLEGLDANTAWVSAYRRGPAPYSATAPGGGAIYRTTNSGATWNNMTATGMFTNTTSSFADFVTFLTPSIGIVVGDPVGGAFEIWRTTNAGLSWNTIPAAAIPAPLSASEFAIVNLYAKYGSSNIWFGTNQGRMYYTNNGGLNWNVSTVAASTSTLTEIAFNSASDGIAYVANSANTLELYNTNDGGVTWTLISPVPANLGFFDICGVPGTSYFVSTGAAANNQIISYSTDNGVTWTDYGSSGVSYLAVDFANGTDGWVGDISSSTPSVGGAVKYSGSAITSTALPTSVFYMPSDICLTGATATAAITNSSTGSPAPTFSWSVSPAGPMFSNQTTSAPTVTFSSGNTYTITLITSNSSGTNSSSQVVNVLACSIPTAGFTSTATVCNQKLFNTSNTSTGGVPAPSYSWSAAPAAGVTFSPSSIAMSPSVIVSTPGSYTLQLVATNNQGSVSSTQNVVVNNCAPVASFTTPSVFDHCRAIADTLRTTNTTTLINGANTYTWSIQPSGGVTILGGVNGPNAFHLSARVTNTTANTFTVTLRATNASGTSSLVQIVTVEKTNCTSISENGLESKLSIYPNPAHDQINIALPSDIASFNVKIMNVIGDVLVNEKVTNNKETISVSLAGRPKGVYFINIEANHQKVTKKIIIE